MFIFDSQLNMTVLFECYLGSNSKFLTNIEKLQQ